MTCGAAHRLAHRWWPLRDSRIAQSRCAAAIRCRAWFGVGSWYAVALPKRPAMQTPRALKGMPFESCLHYRNPLAFRVVAIDLSRPPLPHQGLVTLRAGKTRGKENSVLARISV